jgi:hypothetical protein
VRCQAAVTFRCPVRLQFRFVPIVVTAATSVPTFTNNRRAGSLAVASPHASLLGALLLTDASRSLSICVSRAHYYFPLELVLGP